MHPFFYMRDCDFYLYYTVVLYRLIMIFSIFTLFFTRETQMCILSQVNNVKVKQIHLQLCRTLNDISSLQNHKTVN